jgi:hypothetical protein
MTDAHVLALLWLIETVVAYSLGAVALALVTVGAYSMLRDRADSAEVPTVSPISAA